MLQLIESFVHHVLAYRRQLTDYWLYIHHRWVSDLPLSNRDAVKQYWMSPAAVRRGPRLRPLTRTQPPVTPCREG